VGTAQPQSTAGLAAIAAGGDVGSADVVLCTSWLEGMAALLRARIDTAGDPAAAVVVFGNQPLVTATATERVLSAGRPGAAAVRARYAVDTVHDLAVAEAMLAS
jgi:CTP:molybdopterin cytidylyltransferase MocA